MSQNQNLTAKAHLIGFLENSTTQIVFMNALIITSIGFAFQANSVRKTELQTALNNPCAKEQSQFVGQGAMLKPCKTEKEIFQLKNPALMNEFVFAGLSAIALIGFASIGNDALTSRWKNQIKTAEKQGVLDNTHPTVQMASNTVTIQEPIKLGKRITLKPSNNSV